MSIPYRLTPTSINILLKGKTYSITEDSHQHYAEIREALKVGEFSKVEELIDLATTVNTYGAGHIVVQDGEILYKGMSVHNTLTQRIFEQMREGFDIKPMVAFLENLMQNPSKRAVDELYDFLEACSLPITDDGHFIAYKKVNFDYTDIYTGKISNAVGEVCEMPRNFVDEDKARTCSAGLHFCSESYLRHYGSSNPSQVRVVLVKINPADVVAIPIDYGNAKGRTCRYEVVDEVPVDDLKFYNTSVYVTTDLHDDDEDYLEDDYDDYDDEDDDVMFYTVEVSYDHGDSYEYDTEVESLNDAIRHVDESEGDMTQMRVVDEDGVVMHIRYFRDDEVEEDSDVLNGPETQSPDQSVEPAQQEGDQEVLFTDRQIAAILLGSATKVDLIPTLVAAGKVEEKVVGTQVLYRMIK